MTATYVNLSLITMASAGLALGVRLASRPLVRIVIPPTAPAATVPAASAERQPDSLNVALVARDPFRVVRRPSDVAYDPVGVAQPMTPAPPKPALALVGIVWDRGRDPTALVEGLPGVEGSRPLRRGETVAGLRVKTIDQDRVVITGLDTTWTLRVREQW